MVAAAERPGPHLQPQVQLRHRQVETSATKQREQGDEEKNQQRSRRSAPDMYFGTIQSTGTPERPALRNPPPPVAG